MKKRNEAFFGMHFDFHARSCQKNVGEFCDYETIDRLLAEVKPDYVQCDTKGHPGFSSYPTKVGTPTPEMKGDVLKMWREVTQKHDVALYAHHSGVLDTQAIVEHPDWAACDVNGNPYANENSVFGPYCDERLIPQLIEIATVYKLNGAWVDGDCWASVEDYSVWAKDAYKAETGRDAPAEDDFEGREKYRAFCRRGFVKYVEHYCEEVHKAAPDFEIASNWLYTAYAPEPVTADVDFISGDYSHSNSISTAMFEGRALQNSTKPWDLMCWGFTIKPHLTKEFVQLCAEAGEVISLGGGFQIYNPQLVGTVQRLPIPMWAELSKFCRERESVCHKAKPVKEGAVLLSSKAIYNHKSNLFRWDSETNPYGADTHGLLFALIDAGFSAEILTTPQFDGMTDGDISKYKFIALADLDTIEDDIRERLCAYAEAGGNVIVCGVHATKLFEKELGVKIGEIGERACAYMLSRGRYGILTSPLVDVETNGGKITAIYNTALNENKENDRIFSTVRSLGKGSMTGIYVNYGSYQHERSAGARDAIDDIVSNVCGRKTVEICGTHKAQVAITEKNGAMNVNLLNVSGPHTDARFINYDEILPITDLKSSVACAKKPNRITEMPKGKPMDFSYIDGRAEFVLDKLEIHSVIVIE